MKVSYRVFWLPKAGLSEEEYEDAFAPEKAPEDDFSEFRCAVADGATETSFAKLWADILCKAYNEKNFNLPQLEKEWQDIVSGKKLPWYAEEKLTAGAFATIVGLSLQEKDDTIHWSARALGDSCLFHLRQGKILTSLPVDSWEAFDYTPALLSTKPEANRKLLPLQKKAHGTCQEADLFYLMTDAISKWLLRRESEDGDAVARLEAINTAVEFKQLVDGERQTRDNHGRPLMPNDDVTWTRICVSG
jgi:hypothetical protein